MLNYHKKPVFFTTHMKGYQKLSAVQPRLPERVLAAVRFHSLREIAPNPRLSTEGKKLTAQELKSQRVGKRITRPEIELFQRHLTERDKTIIPFILRMRYFDQETKIRTEDIPRINTTAIKELLEMYFPGGQMRW